MRPGRPAAAFLRPGLQALTDLFWPPLCATCPRALPLTAEPVAADFCPQCLATVEFLPSGLCPVCGRPFYHSPGHICGDCLAGPPPFQETRAALVYRGAVSRSISLLKYQGHLAQVRVLARLAAAALIPPGLPAPDMIIPMPISPKRLAERGFNQSLVLARAIYHPWLERLDEKILTRPADGGLHQAALSRARRAEAIRGCFKVADPGARLRGARVLLFDDVVTTGATAAEAARALLAAGAGEVRLAAVARTVLAAWR